MQVPAPFDYQRAESIDDALMLLERYGEDARVVAGGHSLLPMMKLRLARPELLVDINDLAELDYMRLDGGLLRIGALTRHRTLLESELVGRLFPIFHDAERVIADPPVRNRGTIGGALCQADPAEDLSAVCSAVKARVVIRGRGGDRTVPMPEFYRGPYETAVGAGEMLIEVGIPVVPGSGSAYEKVERKSGDWAVAAAGASVTLAEGRIADAGVGLAAVGAEVLNGGVAAVLLDEALLHRVEPGRGLQPLDRAHRVPGGHRRQHRATLDRLAVEQHHAGAAVAGVAAPVRAGQAQVVAQEPDQQVPRLDLPGPLLAVDLDGDPHRHASVPAAAAAADALAAARRSARTVSSPARCRLYSAEPRPSVAGSQPSAAIRPASANSCSEGSAPISAAATPPLSTSAPTAARPTPASAIRPSASVTEAPAAATAQSPDLRSTFL